MSPKVFFLFGSKLSVKTTHPILVFIIPIKIKLQSVENIRFSTILSDFLSHNGGFPITALQLVEFI